jgi:hypothetical protein
MTQRDEAAILYIQRAVELREMARMAECPQAQNGLIALAEKYEDLVSTVPTLVVIGTLARQGTRSSM